ncbi:IS30 family transposase [Mesomycoplasma molare]|uniref:IS30 family transposase n=1 Tax=Mesomycoplasma molare TaxID=171288 RepID=A0ABY5TVE0_9BACT|nr:IS30 family transposase [Mesomycoplasma molare]UWD34612.1 IS30 family transposase [Mesomycoplasma molare]
MRQIANFLNINHSTVSRELKRNSNFYGFYDHLIANEKAKIRHKHKRLFFFSQMDDYKEFSKLIKDNFNKATCGIKMTYNLIKEGVKNIKIPSLRTVFNWINTGKWVLTNKDRLRKHYTKGGKRKNNVIERLVQSNYVFPIWARPKHIDLRETFGHWEGDLVIGKKSAGHSSLLTLVERKSRLGIIVKVSSKNPFTLIKCFMKE